jgi:hypothetical protein
MSFDKEKLIQLALLGGAFVAGWYLGSAHGTEQALLQLQAAFKARKAVVPSGSSPSEPAP